MAMQSCESAAGAAEGLAIQSSATPGDAKVKTSLAGSVQGSTEATATESAARSSWNLVRWRRESSKPRAATVFNPPAMWMLLFGSVLAACAGMVDAIGFLSLNGALVTHVSGTTARIGMHLEGVRQGEEAAHFSLLHAVLQVSCFAFGAFLCGLVIPKMTLSFGKQSFYGLALLGNSALLLATFLVAPDDVGSYLASMACGLQNAMCTMHFGAVVRTTHVTGTLTDIGSTSGRAAMILMRHGFRYSRLSDFDKAELAADWMKLKVLLPVYVCFLVGAFVGAWLGTHFAAAAFLVPAGITGTLGLIYTFFKGHLKRQWEKYELRRLGREVDLMEAMLEQSGSRRKALEQGHAHLDLHQAKDHEEDLEERVEFMLRVVEDVEAAVGDLPRAGFRKTRSNTAEF